MVVTRPYLCSSPRPLTSSLCIEMVLMPPAKVDRKHTSESAYPWSETPGLAHTILQHSKRQNGTQQQATNSNESTSRQCAAVPHPVSSVPVVQQRTQLTPMFLSSVRTCSRASTSSFCLSSRKSFLPCPRESDYSMPPTFDVKITLFERV
jgi:hypothetical protein